MTFLIHISECFLLHCTALHCLCLLLVPLHLTQLCTAGWTCPACQDGHTAGRQTGRQTGRQHVTPQNGRTQRQTHHTCILCVMSHQKPTNYSSVSVYFILGWDLNEMNLEARWHWVYPTSQKSTGSRLPSPACTAAIHRVPHQHHCPAQCMDVCMAWHAPCDCPCQCTERGQAGGYKKSEPAQLAGCLVYDPVPKSRSAPRTLLCPRGGSLQARPVGNPQFE